MLEYKAESAGVRVVRVTPKGTFERLSYGNPSRDWISACRIRMRRMEQP
jgi:putative transposase